MNKSDEIDKLAVALCKAQEEMGGAVKSSENPFFHSSYADLTSVWKACKDALHANGLSVIQSPVDSDGRIGVSTMLLHTSGQWVSDSFTLGVKKENDPQADGSSITYARRYALAAFVGVCPADDDGEGAMMRKKTSKKTTTQPPFQGHQSQEAGPPVEGKEWHEKGKVLTGNQLTAIRKIGAKNGMAEGDLDLFAKHIYSVNLEKISIDQASNIIGNFDSLHSDYTGSQV